MCFLPNCRYHKILTGNIKELLQKLNFGGKIVLKNGQLFDYLQRAVHFNQQIRGVDRMPSIAKKGLLRRKYKKHFLISFQKTKTTQMSSSSSKINKRFWIAKPVTWIIKDNNYFVPLFFEESMTSKFTPLKVELFNVFLHNIVNWLRVLIKKVNFVKLLLKRSNFEPIVNKLRFSHQERTDQQ